MPISCPLEIRCLSADEFDELDYRVMGQAFASQSELGRLCEEGVYQRDLQARLLAEGFRDVQTEVPVTVSHGEFSKVYFLDLVADNAVYELKTAEALTPEHQAQLLQYLFLVGVRRGKLINFRPPKVDGRLHATSLTSEDRRKMTVDTSRWQDATPQCFLLREAMCGLLADWGAFLSIALYQEALESFFGGESTVVQRLPLHRGRLSLGTQEFRLHSPHAAFQITAFTGPTGATESHLRRLLALTDLQAFQWINLNHASVGFVTLIR